MFWSKVKLAEEGTSDYWCHFPYDICWYVIAAALPPNTHIHVRTGQAWIFHILVSNTTSGTEIVILCHY